MTDDYVDVEVSYETVPPMIDWPAVRQVNASQALERY